MRIGPLLGVVVSIPSDRAVYTLSSKYFSFLIFQDAVYELATAVYLVNLREARQFNTYT